MYSHRNKVDFPFSQGIDISGDSSTVLLETFNVKFIVGRREWYSTTIVLGTLYVSNVMLQFLQPLYHNFRISFIPQFWYHIPVGTLMVACEALMQLVVGCNAQESFSTCRAFIGHPLGIVFIPLANSPAGSLDWAE